MSEPDPAPAVEITPRAPSVTQTERLMLRGIEYARAASLADASGIAEYYGPGESALAWSTRLALQALPELAPDNGVLANARRVADDLRRQYPGMKVSLDHDPVSGTAWLDYFLALPDPDAQGRRYLQFNLWRFSQAPDGMRVIGVHYAAKLEGPGGRRSPLVVQLDIMRLRQAVLPALTQLPAYRP